VDSQGEQVKNLSVMGVLLAGAAGLFCADAANAIVINDDAGLQRAIDLGDPFDDSVVRLSTGCTGTLISLTTVLTAEHCGTAAGDSVFFTDGGATELSLGIESVLDLGPGTDLLDGTDLTIATLDTAATGRTPLRLWDGDIVGLEALTVGYGFSGLGSTGHGNTGDTTRRGATNVIDWYGAAPFSGSGFFDNTANIVSTDFDDPEGTSNTLGGGDIGSSADMLADEGTTAPGDSGGPLLIDLAGEWLIAGVLAGGTEQFSIYGDISWWTGLRTGAARSFVEDGGGVFADITAVPLPAGWALMASIVALGGLAGRRRAG